MKTVVVVQARLGSSRLPAKIMLDLSGKPALVRCLDRVRLFSGVDEVVVATSVDSSDDIVDSITKRVGLRCVRGSENDVLGRFLVAARETRADAIVRITSDCPLLDPRESSRVLAAFASSGADYASNVLRRMFPRGLDTEVFSREALERAARDAVAGPEREHVTLRMYTRRDQFRCVGVMPEDGVDLSRLRWTLDTLLDYRALYAIHDVLGEHAATAGYREIAALCDARPELVALNAHVAQKVA